MENYYKVLGINTSATPEEIRRAYRILARRYHPDVNPGEASAERFKSIAMAYDTLSDAERRRNYDIEFEGELRKRGAAADKAYRRAARAASQAETKRRYAQFQADAARHAESAAKRARANGKQPTIGKALEATVQQAFGWLKRKKNPTPQRRELTGGVQRVSVVEVSLTLRDAITGIKKAIEISEPEGSRKVSVKIPAGSRNGSVIHLRSTTPPGEELVLIVRVAAHPTMTLLPKGLVVEVPVTVTEALCGASITVPTLDEPISIKVPAGSQSGAELRVRERGVLQKDGARGDLFYRLLIKIPESVQAVGLKEKAQELDRYYESTVRQHLPKTLLD